LTIGANIEPICPDISRLSIGGKPSVTEPLFARRDTMFRNALFAVTLALAFGLCPLSAAQNSAKLLTNEDVVAMVKGGLGETTIIAAIQSQNSSFDVSAGALLALKKNAVSSRIMDAMLAANKQQAESKGLAPAPAAPAPAANAQPQIAGQPAVLVVQGGSKQAIPIARTQITQTKTKASSLNVLAMDGALGQAMTSMAVQAGSMAAMRSGSVMGASMMGPASMAVGGFLGHRKPTVTHVWALPGQKSETVLHAAQPAFEIHYESIPGVNADEYEPVILKLEPTNNNFRLVGATQAKQDAFEASAADWGMYSSFIEQRVPSQSKKVAAGSYQLQPSSALGPGQYAVALRPLNKDKKFAGSSVSQNAGDGMMFNSAWAFEVQQ
jgi:hypothetical protein